MDEFQVPAEPGDLWDERSDLPFKVLNLEDLSEGSPEEVGELAEELAFALCDSDPLCIVEQRHFDQLCSLLRAWLVVEGPKRRQLLDALCTSLTCLNAWIGRLLSTPPEALDREALITYRSAYKAYIFFLEWLAELAGRESREAGAAQPVASAAGSRSTTAGTGRGRKKAAARQEVAGWQWAEQFPKVVKAAAQALDTDLRALFRPNRPEEGLLQKAIKLATMALESPLAAKDEVLAGHAAHVFAVAALRYEQLEVVASTLVELLAKHEHTPELVAELLRYSADATWGDARLAAAVIGEVAAVDPVEYERQQKAAGEKAGVRSVAAFVEHLAHRLPRVLAQQISVLLPHLGGEAHVLRCAIVTAIAQLLLKGFDASGDEVADAQGAKARRETKQHLLDVLCERVRDQTSYVRKDVLQAWQVLAAGKAIPLGLWKVREERKRVVDGEEEVEEKLGVIGIAIGRLEDKSSLVRKEALRLLQSLMLDNPFGPCLAVERYANSLQHHQAMLDLLVPPEPAAEEGVWQQPLEVQPEGAAGGDGEAAEGDGEGTAAGDEAAGASEDAEEEMGDAEEVENPAVEEQVLEQQEPEAAAAPKPQPPARTPAEVGWNGTLVELQALVASLKSAVEFASAIASTMPTLAQLLASSTTSDVQESIAMLLTCKKFQVDGASETIKKMLPLVFSREATVKAHIVGALDQLYIQGWAGNVFSSEQAARNLIELASGATLGELGALEEVVKEFLQNQHLSATILHELWGIAEKAFDAVTRNATQAERAQKDLRAALALLSMVAAPQPQSFKKQQLLSLLRYGFSSKCPDALITRHACCALQRLADNFQTGAYDDVLDSIYAALTRTIIASPLPEASWFSAAEAAVSAIYALHPAPEQLCVAILKQMAGRAFQSRAVEAALAAGGGGEQPAGEQPAEDQSAMEEEQGSEQGPSMSGASGASGQPQWQRAAFSASALSRFFFVLGHVALQHLVYVERMAKAVRRSRHEAEKKAAEEMAERLTSASNHPDKEEDINAQLGVGSVAADAELDAMKEASEGQMLRNLLGPYARIVAAVCHPSSRVLMNCDAQLQASALLALTKLMVVDAHFCEQNLPVLFTLLRNRSIDQGIRTNLIIALGDLALRFPNLLEPWTENIYRPLAGEHRDPDVAVRKNTLMVLTHLILNDMMKVKGHIAKMAACLEDEDERIRSLAQLFFHELAKKEYKGTSPIYNLLPDILSNLSKESTMSKAQFQSIMQQLLAHIKKDKQGDALIEKLCQRFAATDDPQQWHNIAFCLTQLPSSEKGLKKLCESFKLYKHALGDKEVSDAITDIFKKSKKGSAKAETKALIEEFETKLTEYAAERAEEERTAEAARLHAERRRGGGAQSETTASMAAPTDSGLVSDMRAQMAGLDMNAGQSVSEADFQGIQIKPDPDAPGMVCDGVAEAALPGAPGEGDQDGIEDREEDEGAPLPPPSAGRGRRTASAASAAAAAGGRAARGRSRSLAGRRGPAVVEEGDEEGQEQQPAASEATVEAASAPKAARGSSRRSTAGRGGVSRRRAEPDSSAGEEEEEENAHSAANLPPQRRGRASSMGTKGGTARRSSKSSLAEAQAGLDTIQIKEEPL